MILAVAAVLAALAAYAATGLRLNISTDDILAQDLPFRERERAFAQAFPDTQNQLIVVVDAPSSDRADAAAARLAEALRQRPQLFRQVEVPGATPFFQRHGLLYLPVDQLESVLTRLATAQPALSTLAQEPNLRGFAGLFDLIGMGASVGTVPPELLGIVRETAETAQSRAEGGEAALNWPALLGFEGAREGTRRLILVDPVLDESSLQGGDAALEGLRQAISAVTASEVGDGVRIRFTGEPALRQQELHDAFDGAFYAAALAFILVALSLFIGIRSGRLIAALLVTLVIGSIGTTGLASVTVGQLNLISIAFLVLFFGLGIDFGTHFGLRYLDEARSGASPGEAITRAALGEGPAISLSAVCASIGFLSFVPTDYVGLAELGIISALGMAVALVLTFTALPALIQIWPPNAPQQSLRRIPIGSAIRRHANGILVVASVAILGAAALVPSVRLDVNPLNLQNPETEPVQTYRDLAENPETSPYALEVLAPSFEAARSLADRLGQLQGVSGVRTVSSFVPDEQDEKLDLIEETAGTLVPAITPAGPPQPLGEQDLEQGFQRLRATAASLAASPNPELAEAATRLVKALDRFAQERGTGPEQLGMLGEALTGGIPPLMQRLRGMLSLSEPISIESLPQDLRRDWVAPGGIYRVQVLPTAEIGDTRSLESFARQVQSVAPGATGVPVLVTEAGSVVLRAFGQAILYTVIAIAALVAILRRRLSDVLLILAPLALASLWTVAASAALDLPFNFANVIVIPLLIGLGVASSIHIVVRAREVAASDGEGQGRGLVLDTSTPVAVLITQLNTAAAFSTLAVSNHYGLFSMGVLLGLAILFVLLASLIVLPALMIVLDRHRAPAAGAR